MKRALWFGWILGACIPAQPPPSYGAPAAAGEQAAAASGLSCMQLFSCFQGCADGQCIQGCLGQAEPAAQAAASAYMTCGAQCENGAPDCLSTRCASEMAECTGAAPPAVAQAAEQETMLEDQPHTTANLLPWMTGQWIGTNHQFEFFGDGRVRQASGVPLYSQATGRYACVSVVNEIGTVRQEGDLLIMDFAPADSNHCGDKNIAAAGLTVRYRISWYKYSTLPTNLRLTDIDCTRGEMFCSEQLRRR